MLARLAPLLSLLTAVAFSTLVLSLAGRLLARPAPAGAAAQPVVALAQVQPHAAGR